MRWYLSFGWAVGLLLVGSQLDKVTSFPSWCSCLAASWSLILFLVQQTATISSLALGFLLVLTDSCRYGNSRWSQEIMKQTLGPLSDAGTSSTLIQGKHRQTVINSFPALRRTARFQRLSLVSRHQNHRQNLGNSTPTAQRRTFNFRFTVFGGFLLVLHSHHKSWLAATPCHTAETK